MELGVLKSVNARQQWNNEAYDFTPWLHDNITELAAALNIELEVENKEVACGAFSADIVATEVATGKYVVIENQLEKTDHDHLGKGITYAAVLEAGVIVWIATSFTPEHKKALDWLNDHTTEEVSFYGVQIELWQIDNSKPAVKFNVICKPNEAVRQAAKIKANEDLSESRRFQYEFWSKFRDKLLATKKIPSLQAPQPRYWFDISLGKSHIKISNTCNTDTKTVGVRIYIGNKIVDEMLPYLESRKDEIEKFIGQNLNWNPNPLNADKVIILQHPTDFNSSDKLNVAIDWLVEYTIKAREIFCKIINEQNSGNI